MNNEQTEKSGKACPSCSGRKTIRPDQLKRSLASRLARIEGQVRGIKRMLEEDAYCDDVMAQIAAARGALGKASLAVLDHHMKHCLIDHVKAGDDSIIDELIDSIARNF
ncbi:MAG: metal-sensitive transcriptional regulator [Spirochaetia bacterium]|nr:metal-sensitive transcriptional regulator [Spirochaetia bacterium]